MQFKKIIPNKNIKFQIASDFIIGHPCNSRMYPYKNFLPIYIFLNSLQKIKYVYILVFNK